MKWRIKIERTDLIECNCCLGEFPPRQITHMRSPLCGNQPRAACPACARTGGHGLGWVIR